MRTKKIALIFLILMGISFSTYPQNLTEMFRKLGTR